MQLASACRSGFIGPPLLQMIGFCIRLDQWTVATRTVTMGNTTNSVERGAHTGESYDDAVQAVSH